MKWRGMDCVASVCDQNVCFRMCALGCVARALLPADVSGLSNSDVTPLVRH